MMTKNGETGSNLTACLNGRSKLSVAVIAFLWSALVGVGSWAVGSSSAGHALLQHEALPAHPIAVERMDRLEKDLLARLGSIDRRLTRIENKVDGSRQ